MDIRVLEYFVVCADELNITKAAKILNISQPPLSYNIKMLEEELGTKLFIRGKRSLQLTEAGELLYSRAKEIIDLNNKAKEEIISLKKGINGTISFGLVEGMVSEDAGDCISKFLQKYPNVKFKILHGNSDDILDKLRIGSVSLAVINGQADEEQLHSFVINTEEFVAIIPKDNPLSNKETISIKDLKNQPLILPTRKYLFDVVNRWFKKEHQEPNVICQIDSTLDAAALVKKNIGICICPKMQYLPQDGIVIKTIENVDNNIQQLFVWRKGRSLPKLEQIFIDFSKDYVNKKYKN